MKIDGAEICSENTIKTAPIFFLSCGHICVDIESTGENLKLFLLTPRQHAEKISVRKKYISILLNLKILFFSAIYSLEFFKHFEWSYFCFFEPCFRINYDALDLSISILFRISCFPFPWTDS